MLGSGMAGKAKLNEQHLVHLSNDARSVVRKEDQVTAGSSLLNFMNLASGNVKTALEKPANFKRNINHRRYLQKQLRNYSKRKNDTIPKKPKDVLKHKAHTGDKHGVSRNSSKQEGSSKISEQTAENVNFEQPSMRERNLPPSFWQEPVIQDDTEAYMYSVYPLHARAGESEDPYNPAYETFFESGWNECITREIPAEELSQSGSAPGSVSSEEAICDDFLTGEELTRSIDIKDLYVPELYITDRSPHESSQGESLYLAPISPTQYVLTPTSCAADQAYFNFSFDHDPSGLPPFAMAFLSPGSLTPY